MSVAADKPDFVIHCTMLERYARREGIHDPVAMQTMWRGDRSSRIAGIRCGRVPTMRRVFAPTRRDDPQDSDGTRHPTEAEPREPRQTSANNAESLPAIPQAACGAPSGITEKCRDYPHPDRCSRLLPRLCDADRLQRDTQPGPAQQSNSGRHHRIRGIGCWRDPVWDRPRDHCDHSGNKDLRAYRCRDHKSRS